MNFMSMGILELAVVMLVAFLVLGPSRAVDMARNAGKVLGDLRRSFGDVTSAMTVETMEQKAPVNTRGSGSLPGVPMRDETPPDEAPDAEPPDTNPSIGDSGENKDKE